MGYRREFEIAFVGLKPGIHEYEYEITDKFFEAYQEQDFRNCHANIKLSLDRKQGFMLLKFEIGGNLETNCDRCGNNLKIELWDEFNIVVKMVEDSQVMNELEEDPDIYFIGHSESHIDVADWIYEFINLSIPMQKTCGYDEANGPQCNPAALNTLKELEPEEQPQEAKENPIWKGLEKFKDLGKK